MTTPDDRPLRPEDRPLRRNGRTRRPTTRPPAGERMPLDFEGLARDYSRGYFGYALRALGSREDAEEVVSDALFKIYQRWDRVLESRSAPALAFKIFKDVLRSRQRELLRKPVEWVPIEDLDLVAMDDAFAEREAVIALGEAMAELERTAPRQAECVRLRHFCGLPYAQIAAMLDITVSAAKASATMGKRRLCHKDDHDPRRTGRDEETR